jgi:hypothetical protein
LGEKQIQQEVHCLSLKGQTPKKISTKKIKIRIHINSSDHVSPELAFGLANQKYKKIYINETK